MPKQIKSDKQDTVITVIPFSGFYETWHAQMLQDELSSLWQDESGHEGEEPDDFYKHYNWHAIELEYCKLYVDAFKDRLKEDGIELPSLAFERLESPKEYNFTTDRIFCYLSTEDLLKLYKFVSTQKLAEKVRERFTSGPGFASFYPNRLDGEWLKPVTEWDHNQIETLILSAMAQAGIEEDALEAHELMEDYRGNGAFHNIVWDNLSPEGRKIAGEYAEKNGR